MKHSAIGAHVFAGGMTTGFVKHFDVRAQFEAHHFGIETAKQAVEVIDADSAAEWRDFSRLYAGCRACFGNPRCTGFSCVTAGCDETAHGPWSKQTKDIHELCEFGIEAGCDVVMWESVQQAYTVGRPLLNYLRDELFVPKGYRVAHVMQNGLLFGNSQLRRRYFFVAYRGFTLNFETPTVPARHATVRDVIGKFEGIEARPIKWKKSVQYDEDCHERLHPTDQKFVALMRQGENINDLFRDRFDEVRHVDLYRTIDWRFASSGMPFGMEVRGRLDYDRHAPTLTSAQCGAAIHPKFDRTLTFRELSAVMGWYDGFYPRGRDHPNAQIAKGVIPDVAKWLAENVAKGLDGCWPASEDREATHTGRELVERDARGAVEKVINLTRLRPPIGGDSVAADSQ